MSVLAVQGPTGRTPAGRSERLVVQNFRDGYKSHLRQLGNGETASSRPHWKAKAQ